jgi:hypothetical protein
MIGVNDGLLRAPISYASWAILGGSIKAGRDQPQVIPQGR